MSDEELISAAREARSNAHSAWKNADDTRPTDWSGSSRRFLELIEEIKKRGLDHQKVFQIQSVSA